MVFTKFSNSHLKLANELVPVSGKLKDNNLRKHSRKEVQL